MSSRAETLASSDAFLHAPVAYSILDLDGRQVAANPAFRELFRLEDTGIGVTEMTHEGDRERTAVYLDLLKSGARERVVVDKRYVRGDGTTFWGRLSAGALLDDEGRPELLIGVIEDVTTQIDALARLKAASDAKSSFVARVSHDLRTPLHAIRGLAELLALADLAPEQQEFVGAIQREADTLRALVDDLLDLSRLEAGRLEVNPAAFALGTCVRGAVDLLRPRAESRGLSLELTIEPETDRVVWGDGERLRQVLVNLIDNAIKFTSEGSVGVTMRTAERDDVIISVRDTGVGIDAVDVERIFQPFGRAHTDFTGTGLGLTISKDLIEAMGGSLGLESTPGRGSVFTIRIPLPPAIDNDRSLDRSLFDPHARHERPKVLVVEDSPINQLLAAAQLDQIGCDHEIAASGTEALAALAERDFDLVLMDWHLPDMDGIETTQRLRRAEGTRGTQRIPVIAVTARTMTGDRQRCLDAGMDDFLAKPVSMSDLARAVRGWVSAELADLADPEDPGGQWESSSASPVADTDVIERLRDDLGDESLVASLITTFLEELPNRRRAITDGADAGDREAVWRAAHTLKSTSAVLGAAELASVATDIEATARGADGDLAPMARELAAAADRVASEFAGILDRMERS